MTKLELIEMVSNIILATDTKDTVRVTQASEAIVDQVQSWVVTQ